MITVVMVAAIFGCDEEHSTRSQSATSEKVDALTPEMRLWYGERSGYKPTGALMVKLQSTAPSQDIQSDPFCSATLLCPTVAVTALHCLTAYNTRFKGKQVRLRPNNINYLDKGMVFSTAEEVTRPNQTFWGLPALGVPAPSAEVETSVTASSGGAIDAITLLKLKSPITADYPEPASPDGSDQNFLGVGYGFGAENDRDVPTSSPAREMFKDFWRLGARRQQTLNFYQDEPGGWMISMYAGPRKGGCGGDSGGPLLFTDSITGKKSIGGVFFGFYINDAVRQCDDAVMHYVSFKNHLDWINSYKAQWCPNSPPPADSAVNIKIIGAGKVTMGSSTCAAWCQGSTADSNCSSQCTSSSGVCTASCSFSRPKDSYQSLQPSPNANNTFERWANTDCFGSPRARPCAIIVPHTTEAIFKGTGEPPLATATPTQRISWPTSTPTMRVWPTSTPTVRSFPTSTPTIRIFPTATFTATPRASATFTPTSRPTATATPRYFPTLPPLRTPTPKR